MTERTGERRAWFDYFRKPAEDVDRDETQASRNDLLEFGEGSDSSSDSDLDLESDSDSEAECGEENDSGNSPQICQLPVSDGHNYGNDDEEDEDEESNGEEEGENEADDTDTIVPQTMPTMKRLRAMEDRLQFLEEIFDMLTVKLSQKRRTSCKEGHSGGN